MHNPRVPFMTGSATLGRVGASITPDEELIGRIAAGDKLAMQVLFARHHVRVYRFVLRLLRDPVLAEDLVSEAFLEVWHRASRFEGRSSALAWLLAIARFKALSALRRRPHEELPEEADAIADPADDPESATQKRDESEILRKCLNALSASHREIIDLVYYHQQSVAEVAKIIGIPENTVKTRMFYGRKRLCELLAAAGVERARAAETVGGAKDALRRKH